MANISVTYTFTNGSTADADEVNQNFTDIINGTSDGTKDLSVSAITAAGTLTANGAVNIGNATSDDITITGRIASDIDPKTAGANTLGDATQTWRALYVDNTVTDGGAIYFDAGSTEFLKSTADGTTLDIGGFTRVTAAGAIRTSTDFEVIDSGNVGTFSWTPTTSRTLTFPDATDTVMVLGQTQTVSGTITFSAGNLRLAAVSAGNASSPYMTASDDTNTGIYTAADVFGISAGGNAGLEVRSGGVVFGNTAAAAAGSVDIYTGSDSAAAVFIARDSAGTMAFQNGNMNSATGTASSNAHVFTVNKDSSSSRSINAAGTVNASGADYAEYMVKANEDDIISKGEVCGINKEGKLTKRFSESIYFMVKSTDPSYVGGDTWFCVEPSSFSSKEEHALACNAARKKVDRIAFSGQVPVIVHNSVQPGDYLVPREGPNDSIECHGLRAADVTLDDLKKKVGVVFSTKDGKILAAVGVS